MENSTLTPVFPPLVDLRSDTVTRPTAAMREAVAAFDFGQETLGEQQPLLFESDTLLHRSSVVGWPAWRERPVR